MRANVARMHAGPAAAGAPSGTSPRLRKSTGTMVTTISIRTAPLKAGVTSRLRRESRIEIAIWKRAEARMSAARVAAPPCSSAMMQKGMAVGDG